MRPRHLLLLSLLGSFTSACRDPGSVGDLDAGGGNEQLPPTGRVALTSWIADGAYKRWRCEPTPHESRDPSPHSLNRICSNDLLSAHGDGPYPVGAANVKELFGADGTLLGHAVYRRVLPAEGGAGWYWFEEYDGQLFADGLGDSGAPKTSCVGCHEGAGPSSLGHDLVFTQVR